MLWEFVLDFHTICDSEYLILLFCAWKNLPTGTFLTIRLCFTLIQILFGESSEDRLHFRLILQYEGQNTPGEVERPSVCIHVTYKKKKDEVLMSDQFAMNGHYPRCEEGHI